MLEKSKILFIAIFAVIAAVIAIAQAFKRSSRWKKRKHDMRTAADEWGFVYSESADDPALPDDEFGLLPSYRLHCMMKGELEGTEVVVFDYQSTTISTRQSKVPRLCTMIMLRDQELALPSFTLHANVTGVLKFMADKGTTSHRITFDDDPYFNTNSLLGGDDGEAIRKVFSPEVRQFINSQDSQVYEGHGDVLLVVHTSMIELNTLETLLSKAFTFLGMIKQ